MKKLFFGIAIVGFGTFAMAQEKKQVTEQQKAEWQAKKAEKQRMHLDEMRKELNLNDAQVEKVKALQDKMHMQRTAEMQNKKEMMMERRTEMDAKKKEMNDEMRSILTPEQYKKWEAKKQEKMQMRKEKMGEKHDRMLHKDHPVKQ